MLGGRSFIMLIVVVFPYIENLVDGSGFMNSSLTEFHFENVRSRIINFVVVEEVYHLMVIPPQGGGFGIPQPIKCFVQKMGSFIIIFCA